MAASESTALAERTRCRTRKVDIVFETQESSRPNDPLPQGQRGPWIL